MQIHRRNAEHWRVTLVDTGELTMTGGRLKRVKSYLDDEEAFCFTYGDGVSDINVSELISHHKASGRLATVTAVQPPGRYGALDITGDKVKGFLEKPKGEGGWINGGFFVLSPKCIDYIQDDSTVWEQEPLEQLATRNELSAYRHDGFWQPMDTLREKTQLEGLWSTNKAPWKTW